MTPRDPARPAPPSGRRPAAVGHRRPDRRAQTSCQPVPWRDGRQRLGERPATAVRIPAAPPSLVPPQLGARPGHRKVTGPGDPPGVRALRAHTTPRTASGLLIAGYQGQYRHVVAVEIDADHLHPAQPQQPRRIVGQARGPLPWSSSFATRRITERHRRSASIKVLIRAGHRHQAPSSSMRRYPSDCPHDARRARHCEKRETRMVTDSAISPCQPNWPEGRTTSWFTSTPSGWLTANTITVAICSAVSVGAA